MRFLMSTVSPNTSLILRMQWRLIFADVISSSRLWLWVGSLICFKFTSVFFLFDVFYGCFFSSTKGINRLISEGMSYIYLKVTIEKNWRSQDFDFLSLENLSPGQFLESFNSRRYNWILKILVATWESEVWEQSC